MESYAIIGMAVFGLAIVIVTVLLLVSRAASRRDRLEKPLDPDTVATDRAAERASQAIQNSKQSYREGTDFWRGSSSM